MESLEFYAQLLYQSRMLGGPKKLTDEQVSRLYEIEENSVSKESIRQIFAPTPKKASPAATAAEEAALPAAPIKTWWKR